MSQKKLSIEPKPVASSATKVNTLSQEDVDRLLNPAEAVSARIDVTGKLTDSYQHIAMNKDEQVIAEQIFRLLVRDTELEIRKKLSHQLKASGSLPRDIAMTMASDVSEVALPVLEHSMVLTDKDLADLIAATPDAQRHIAIARRSEVSEQVVEALLANTDEVMVATTLASNHGATLNPGAVEVLMQRHQGLPQVVDMLANRPNLPPTVKEKVIAHVSDQIKQQLAGQHDEVKDIVEKEASQSRLQATLELINNDLSEEEMVKLVQQLQSFERLTPALLMASAVRGYIHFYVTAMSVLAQIPVENALKLMRDRSGLGFRGLYNKCDLPAEHYTVLRDITPFAIALKDELSAAEDEAFAKLLSRRVVAHFKALEKPSDHIVTAIKEALK